MNIFNLIFKHKTMSEEEKSEQAIDEAIDNVPDKADEVFRDKPENAEGGLKEEDTTEPTDEPEDTEELPEEEVETETDSDPELVEDKEAEPLYQKKVYIVDLNNIGLKIEGEGELVVDVMSIDEETQKATVKNGDLTMEVPKDFLF